jgi:hypothetical protein
LKTSLNRLALNIVIGPIATFKESLGVAWIASFISIQTVTYVTGFFLIQSITPHIG